VFVEQVRRSVKAELIKHKAPYLVTLRRNIPGKGLK